VAHRLLLVDDSVTIQRVIELTFAGEDIEVSTARDGDEAMARIERERPDIVLADIDLPRRSGYELAAWMRVRPGLETTPVLLLAGAFEPVDEARAREVGSDGVLVKPFDPRQVIARVRELLAKGRVEPTASPLPAALHAPSARPEAAIASPRDPALDDYFERLSEAFEARQGDGAADPLTSSDEASLPWVPTLDALLAADAAPEIETESHDDVADAFVALLAVEQGEPGARRPRLASVDRRLEEALARRVATRVVAQLSPDAMREALAPLVSDLASRVAREEMARLRAPEAGARDVQ
jgi:DNA-binding response OmpR family regulator